jgi:hypothetical protein
MRHTMPWGEFWSFSILFDAKSNPSKRSLSEIHFVKDLLVFLFNFVQK